jgi:hypothetical protein
MKRPTTTSKKDETTRIDVRPPICAVARTLLAFNNMVVMDEANLSSITDQEHSEMTMSEHQDSHSSSAMAVPSTVIVATFKQHDSDQEEENEEGRGEKEQDDDEDEDDDGYDNYFNATSSSGTGVYFRNRELVRTSFHALQQIGPTALRLDHETTTSLDNESSSSSEAPWPVPPAGKPMLPAPALVRHTWTTATKPTTSSSNKSASQLAAVPLRSSLDKPSYYCYASQQQKMSSIMKSGGGVVTDCMSVSFNSPMTTTTTSRPLLPPPFVLGCFSSQRKTLHH